MADPRADDLPADDPLAGRRVLVGVTGGIAAYKAGLLVRGLRNAGAEVDVVLTRGGARFVGAATFEGLTGRPVRHDVWDGIAEGSHVALGRAADVAVVYPATAHTLAKLAGGLADDLLTTTLLAATCPVVLAPAMHTEMWEHAATRHNVATLRSRGAIITGPDDGLLMGGDAGPGRLVEPEAALEVIRDVLACLPSAGGGFRAGPAQDLVGTHVLVTAGGTREPVDPVRYLGNRSSGRMGFALAAAARDRGATVTLIAGPSELPTPAGVRRVDVTTALEMHAAVFDHLDDADVVIKAAAVADFRPVDPAATKLKKERGVPTLALTPNPDILSELAAARDGARDPVLVGFAAETDEVEAHGRAKLARKGADLLVVNDVSATDAGFEVETNRVVILDRAGGRSEVPLAGKHEVASRILDRVVAWRSSRSGASPVATDGAGAGAG
ncbi:MAG: bifunctional phosphopantothenoylcysteine decarboxylase/phosphopantothenate--cysteine ligase CoaBC [Nitriliruptoraceae bacterium]